MTVKYRIEADNQGTPVIESDYVSRLERMSAGQDRRKDVPRGSHAGWLPPPERRDPIEVLEETRYPAN